MTPLLALNGDQKFISIDRNRTKVAAKNITIRAGLLADQIAPQYTKEMDSSKIIIRNYYHTPYWSWTPHLYQPVYVCRGDRERYKSDSVRTLVGIVATISLGLAAYFVGSAINRYQDSCVELKALKNHQDDLNLGEHRNTLEYEVLSTANYIGDLHGKICTRIRNSALADIVVNIGLVFFCAMTALSSFYMLSGICMTIGLMGCSSVGLAKLMKKGLESSFCEDIHEAGLIRAGIVRFNQLKNRF